MTIISLENFINNSCFIVLLSTMLFYWIRIGFGNLDSSPNRPDIGFFGMSAANLLLFVSLILRWKSSQHFPLSNL